MKLTVKIFSCFAMLMATSCGITKSDYVDYNRDATGGGGPTTCPESVTSMNTELAAMMGACGTAGCHGSGAGGFTFGTEKGEADRKALKSKVDAKGGTGQGLMDFVKGHTGASAYKEEYIAKIETWLAVEKACK